MEQRQLYLRDILAVLFRRKTLIVGFILLTFVLVFVGNYVWPETYESIAKVQVKRGRETMGVDPSVLEIGAAIPMVQMSSYDVNTIIDLVYSNDVLRNVVEATELDRGMTGGLMQLVRGTVREAQYALQLKSRPDPVQEAVEDLRRAIRVDPVRESYVLEIRCHMGEPEQASAVLIALIEQFQEKHKEVYSTTELSAFFTEQFNRVREELEEAQADLRAYRNENRIVALDVEKERLVEEYSNAQRLLGQLEDTEAVTDVLEDDDVIEMVLDDQAIIDRDITVKLSQQTESTVVTELQLRLLDKIVDRNRLRNTLGPRHPQVVGIHDEIRQLTDRLREAIASTREMTIKRIADIEEEVERINDRIGEFENLERDVEIAAENYEYYRKKIEESTVYDRMAEENISSIRITSSPTLPDNPIRPRRMLNLVLALIGGTIGGASLAFFFEYLDHGLKTPEDVDYYLGVPALASFFQTPYEQLDPRGAQRLSAVIDSLPDRDPVQVLTVASSIAGEGSHRVARALADAQADAPDARTLLLDFVGDGLLEKASGRGIGDVLEGECDLDAVVSRMGNLSVIGRGGQSELPAFLWRSEQLKVIITRIRRDYTRIVVHTAPILTTHDTIHMMHHADGLLLVTRAYVTRREVVQRAMDTLGEAKHKLIGVVLTERKQIIPQAIYRRL